MPYADTSPRSMFARCPEERAHCRIAQSCVAQPYETFSAAVLPRWATRCRKLSWWSLPLAAMLEA